MTQPDRKKIRAAIGNLDTTLESIYLRAWHDGYEAGLKECAKSILQGEKKPE